MRRSPSANQRAYLQALAGTVAPPASPAAVWDRLRLRAQKRAPWLAFLALVFLMTQLDSARATDIELAPVDDGGLPLAILGFVCAAPLPALAALLYGLRRARRPATEADTNPTLEAV